MSATAKLTTYDHDGETLRERDVAAWFIRDNGENEDEDGVYVSLNSTVDLMDNVGDTGVGLSIGAGALKAMGFYRPMDLLDEETLLSQGYVKVFEAE